MYWLRDAVPLGPGLSVAGLQVFERCLRPRFTSPFSLMPCPVGAAPQLLPPLPAGWTADDQENAAEAAVRPCLYFVFLPPFVSKAVPLCRVLSGVTDGHRDLPGRSVSRHPTSTYCAWVFCMSV